MLILITKVGKANQANHSYRKSTIKSLFLIRKINNLKI
jgi:hypothetical protein